MTKKELRKSVYDKCDGKCAYCGEELPYEKMHVDHIKPVIRDMEYNREKRRYVSNGIMLKPENHCFENMLPSCRACNNWKHSFDLETFRWDIEQQIIRLNKYSGGFRLAKRYGLVEEYGKAIVFYFETLPTLKF